MYVTGGPSRVCRRRVSHKKLSPRSPLKTCFFYNTKSPIDNSQRTHENKSFPQRCSPGTSPTCPCICVLPSPSEPVLWVVVEWVVVGPVQGPEPKARNRTGHCPAVDDRSCLSSFASRFRVHPGPPCFPPVWGARSEPEGQTKVSRVGSTSPGRGPRVV